MSRSLYEISAEWSVVLDRIVEEGDITEEIAAELEGLGEELGHKADNIIAFILDAEGDAEKLKAEAKRQTEKARRLENTAKRLRAYLLDGLIAAGVKSIDTERFGEVKRVKNPFRVEVDDSEALPEEFITGQLEVPWAELDEAGRNIAVRKIDRKGILAALKGGEEVSGAHMEQGERLKW